MTEAPLLDPGYVPKHPPVKGIIPEIVKKWGPRSQLRWFKRFWGSSDLPTVRPSVARDYFCDSTQHRGFCCSSCAEDEEYYGYPVFDDFCCCRGYNKAKEANERSK